VPHGLASAAAQAHDRQQGPAFQAELPAQFDRRRDELDVRREQTPPVRSTVP
jgi:hypothetical protein